MAILRSIASVAWFISILGMLNCNICVGTQREGSLPAYPANLGHHLGNIEAPTAPTPLPRLAAAEDMPLAVDCAHAAAAAPIQMEATMPEVEALPAGNAAAARDVFPGAGSGSSMAETGRTIKSGGTGKNDSPSNINFDTLDGSHGHAEAAKADAKAPGEVASATSANGRAAPRDADQSRSKTIDSYYYGKFCANLLFISQLMSTLQLTR